MHTNSFGTSISDLVGPFWLTKVLRVSQVQSNQALNDENQHGPSSGDFSRQDH